jgi:hypothetical protein
MTLHSAVAGTPNWVRRYTCLQGIFSFPPVLSPGSDVRLCSTQGAQGWGSRANDSDRRVFRAGAPRLPREFWSGGKGYELSGRAS